MKIKAVIFDFGGVLAEEGFREGLSVIATKAGLDTEEFYARATQIVYDCGYVLGKSSEKDFWKEVRMQTGIKEEDYQLSKTILDRFIPRGAMIDAVKLLRQHDYRTAILSDQSDWLDVLNNKYDFFKEFDLVFNSFHLGKSKRDPSIFDDISSALHLTSAEILFVDDNIGHINRAAEKGFETHLFTNEHSFFKYMKKIGLPH